MRSFIEFPDAIPTVDGQLARWDKWWPEGTVNELLPDEEIRSVVTSEFPRLKRSFYDEQIQVGPGWTTRPCCYVRLSPARGGMRARLDEGLADPLAWTDDTSTSSATHKPLPNTSPKSSMPCR